MSYELHPAAEAELAVAAKYYAEEATVRVAEAFLAEFERVAELLEDLSVWAHQPEAACESSPFIGSRTRLCIESRSMAPASMRWLITSGNQGTGPVGCSALPVRPLCRLLRLASKL